MVEVSCCCFQFLMMPVFNMATQLHDIDIKTLHSDFTYVIQQCTQNNQLLLQLTCLLQMYRSSTMLPTDGNASDLSIQQIPSVVVNENDEVTVYYLHFSNRGKLKHINVNTSCKHISIYRPTFHDAAYYALISLDLTVKIKVHYCTF